MTKFKIEDKEYFIPDYISIEKYVKIYKIKNLFSDTYFQAKLINIVTDAPLEDLLDCDYQSINYLTQLILSMIPIKNPQFEDRFEIDGINYGFFRDWKDLTFAEFVDLDTISTKKEDDLLDHLHILAAIMYRPIISEKSKHDFEIESYDVNKLKERGEIFKKKLDVKYLLGAQFFFIKFANRFSNYSLVSSMPMMTLKERIKWIWKNRDLMRKILFRKFTGGSLSSTELLKMTLQNTNISSVKK